MPTLDISLSRRTADLREVNRACSFCRRFDSGPAEPAVIETDQFAAWVSHGALVEGHLLVIPKTHALNLCEMSSQQCHELPRFLEAVEQRLNLHYGPVCMFEHGPTTTDSAAGCSIDHAHMHLLPWPGSLIEAAETDYSDYEWERLGSLSELFAQPPTVPYLFVRDGDGEMALAKHLDIPSQALRRTISSALARGEEWDWKTHPKPETVQETIRRMVAHPA
jgi:ATP adenylyltransferase